MTDERILNEYSAECYIRRTERRDTFAFRAPAEVVEVGESIYVGQPPLETPFDGRLVRVRAIEADARWWVRRFKIGWRSWTPWVLDEQEVLIDADDNPFYTRGSRRHYLNDGNWYAKQYIR